MTRDGTGRRGRDHDVVRTSRRGPVRATMDLLASTRTAIVLLAMIAAAAVVGTILPDAAAREYVYGRVWFHVLLGLLGLSLGVCTVWRKRIGMARIWSLLTHSGILLVLVGAMVTLMASQRGNIVIHEGRDADSFLPEGADPHQGERRPLGETAGF